MKGKTIIFLSSTSFFLSYFSRVSWSIIAPLSPFKSSLISSSIIFALFFTGYILAQLPAGILSDYLSAKLLIILSLVGIAITSVISGYYISLMIEYITSFFMGFSSGWIYPITIKVLSNTFSGKDLPIAMSMYSLAWPTSIVASGIVITFLALRFSWEIPFYFIAILSIILAILSSFFLPSMRVQSQRIEIKTLISNKSIIFIAIGGFLFFLSYWILVLYLYKYLLDVIRNAYLSGLIYSFTALAGILSTILSGYLINKMGLKKTVVFSILFYSFSIVMISLTFNIIYLGLIAIFIGFFRFIITPANSTILALEGGKEKSGSVTGISNLFWQSSGILASLVSPLFIEIFSYTYLWIFVGLISLVSLVFYSSLKNN